MIYINIQNKWQCYFFLNKKELPLMLNILKNIKVSEKSINGAIEIMNSINSGVTNSNLKKRTSVVGISDVTSTGQWFDTLVHELKHVQSHICEYYNVSERSEEAAYLIGYLIRQIINKIKRL